MFRVLKISRVRLFFAYAVLIALFIMFGKCSSLVNGSNGVRGELLGIGSVDENGDCFFDEIGGIFIGPDSRVVPVFIETIRGKFFVFTKSSSQSLLGSRVVSVFIEIDYSLNNVGGVSLDRTRALSRCLLNQHSENLGFLSNRPSHRYSRWLGKNRRRMKNKLDCFVGRYRGLLKLNCYH